MLGAMLLATRSPAEQRVDAPDAKVRTYLVYLKYWTLNLVPLVYPKALFHPNFSIKGQCTLHSCCRHRCQSLAINPQPQM